MRSFWVIVLAAGIGAGCAGVFPQVPRSAGYEASGLCTPASGVPRADARAESVGIAGQVLASAFAAIANEHPEEHRQQIERTRVPVQRFPRLTFPALLDPEPAAGARQTPGWFFPLILAEEEIGYLPAVELQSELRFSLVPHGRDVASETWFDITDCIVRQPDGPGDIYSITSDPEAFLPGAGELLEIALLDLPTLARGEDLRGVVFEVPTKLSAGSASIAPGFYDLKVLPRLGSLRDLSLATPSLAEIAASLGAGDWWRAVQGAQSLTLESLSAPEAASDLRRFAQRVDQGHPAPNFAPDLNALSLHLEELAAALEALQSEGASAEDRKTAALDGELELSRVERAMRTALSSRRSLAPVALRDPAREPERCGGEDCVRFAISGDLQYHGDVSNLLLFLERFDPEVLQPGSGDLTASEEPPIDIDFVLLAGDVADSAASTDKGQLALNFLGVLPPSSPYAVDGGKEMSDVAEVLMRFQKPFFAVPGNHDGYAGFGGILNVLIDEFGNLTRVALNAIDRDWGRSAASGIKAVNNYVPTLAAWRLLNRMPRYDGLGEFQNYLGTLNLAFKFRGHSFIGVNSYDLTAKERAAMGGVIINWGGGLQDESVDWLEDVLNRFKPDARGGQFVFMHHDPRAAVPQNSSYAEDWYGYYDPTDSYISRYTFGHFGIGNSPETGLYLPVVTPLVSYLFRASEIGWGENTGVWQQEWMRKLDMPSLFDKSAYNARGLIDVINCNLAGRPMEAREGSTLLRGDEERCAKPEGRVSHLAFAHNNIPLEELWAEPAQRRAVFRERPGQEWSRNTFSTFTYVGQFTGGKFRNGSPPRWAKRMRLDEEDGNAKVLRLDDVGQIGSYHGFHLVTLYASGKQEIEWVGISR